MRKLFKRVRDILKLRRQSGLASKPFFAAGGSDQILKRSYTDYKEYLIHQSEKLNKKYDQIRDYDQDYEKIIKERYSGMYAFQGKSVLCLAARLGGEVRGFKFLGALAIGIDIEPGPGNEHVLHGDFHNLSFPDGAFDFVFTNAVDHVFDLEQFLKEAGRVIKPEGIFLAELSQEKAGEYESIDTENLEPVLQAIEKYFLIENSIPIKNKLGFVSWSGNLLQMKKRDAE